MVDLYTALIIAGRRTIDTIPAKFKEAVLAELIALGLDGNGNPITTNTSSTAITTETATVE